LGLIVKLVIFDVDGTLVDSQGSIVASLEAAFAEVGLPLPHRERLLSGVGLSLPQFFARLLPEEPPEMHRRMTEAYSQSFAKLRLEAKEMVHFFPHARETVDLLHAKDEVLLGLATGKSQRGLRHLLEAVDLTSRFVTTQVADHHPSKPHPSMILTALSETGVAAEDAVMIGDTTFDRDMANAAGVPFIGVSWGYHPVSHLTGAIGHIEDFRDLPGLLQAHWRDIA
jgi:phosphoglycolate phosphatase